MKKMLKTVIATASTLSTLLSSMVLPQTVSAEASASSGNLITQGDFESLAGQEITKAELTVTNTFFTPRTNAKVVNTEAASGSWSVMLDKDESDNQPRLNIRENLKGGVTYRISAKVKTKSSATAEYYLRVQPAGNGLNPGF